MDSRAGTADGRVRVDDPLVPLVLALTDEERHWYTWLFRELLNAVVLARDPGTLGRVVIELDELVHEVLARVPPR